MPAHNRGVDHRCLYPSLEDLAGMGCPIPMVRVTFLPATPSQMASFSTNTGCSIMMVGPFVIIGDYNQIRWLCNGVSKEPARRHCLHSERIIFGPL